MIYSFFYNFSRIICVLTNFSAIKILINIIQNITKRNINFKIYFIDYNLFN